MLAAVAQYHADHPIAGGMPREELRERVFGKAPGAVFEHALHRSSNGRIVARERVALPGSGRAQRRRGAHTRGDPADPDDAGLTFPIPARPRPRSPVKREVVDRIANLLVRQKDRAGRRSAVRRGRAYPAQDRNPVAETAGRHARSMWRCSRIASTSPASTPFRCWNFSIGSASPGASATSGTFCKHCA